MGLMKINGTPILAPASQMPVREIKALARIRIEERLYCVDGRLLDDDDVVPTDDQEYGSVTDWVRGSEDLAPGRAHAHLVAAANRS
jgi:hypothetical protein